MLTFADVKKLTYEGTFRRGQDLQRFGCVKDFEYSIYGVNESIVADIDARVVDKEKDMVYTTNVIVDEECTDISEYRCTCDEIFRTDGLCRHCVAAVSEYLQKRRVKEVLDVKWKKENNIQRGFRQQTATGIKNILNRVAMEGTSKYLIPEVTRGNVELFPSIVYFSRRMMSVDFKIGMEQKYVIKDISAFLDSLSQSEKISYGKKLEFYHNIEAFSPKSQRLIGFLRECQQEISRVSYKTSLYGFTKSALGRNIELDEMGMEKFFSVMQGEYFEGSIFNLEDTVWYVSEEIIKPEIKMIGDPQGVTLQLMSKEILHGYSKYYICENGVIYKCQPQLKEKLGDFLDYLLEDEFQKCYIAEDELAVFCRDLLPVLREQFILQMESFEESMYLPERPEFELYIDKLEHDIVAGKVMVVYPDQKYNLLEKVDLLEKRNIEEEMYIRRAVEVYFNGVDINGSLFLIRKDEELLYQFLTGGLQRLSELMVVYASEAFQNMKVTASPNVSVGVSLKSNLLELELQSEEMPMDELAYLLSKYDRKKKFIRLKNGDFLRIQKDDGLEILAELKDDLHLSESAIKKGTLVVPKFRAMYLDGSLKNKQALHVDKNKEFKSMVRNMKTIEDSDYEVPIQLKKTMREYQKNGFRWLKTLRENGFGGILADDMGLGKTLQVISLLLNEKEEFQECKEEICPSIVVCPASLVYNWKKEIERFAPELSVCVITGSAKERERQIEEIRNEQIVITSYDLLKRDVAYYEAFDFAIQIIDEAQYIKNASTQAAKAVKKITAGFKLALTGTPIENQLSELWSIFDYLMPGFLYTYNRFRDEIESPIVVNKDENKMERLQRMIRPFVLRRLKKDVLKDLPEKLEENIYAELVGEQRQIYDAHVQRMKMILNRQSDKEFISERFELLAELTKLRQICCDPSLLFEDYKGSSAKTQMCMELVINAVSAGHKVLLFSQFTTMLYHLSERLEREGISFYMLTGTVSKEKRMKMVDDFNQDDTSVFCISLKAGGTGLNLTAADIVIHYDPWWNVAAQNQATDRAHRIGQENVVTVYKLVSHETIEEKIIEIQEKKKELANQVLEGTGMDSSGFSRQELLELLG